MTPRLVGIFVMVFAFGLFSGMALWNFSDRGDDPTDDSSSQVREMGKYRFVSPLLECEVSEASIRARNENFQNELASEIDRVKAEYGLSGSAAYFRDMNNGPAFGVDEAEKFFPASLLKVPVMMAFYRFSEKDPSVLSERIKFSSFKDIGRVQYVIPEKTLVLEESYTIDELIRMMIVYSDNQAMALLLDHLPAEYMKDLFSILGFKSESLDDPGLMLTVKEYASFFRILFNSSYLSRENSEKALTLLSESGYGNGLVSGLPEGVRAAHKFGEFGTGQGVKQLHDCGIVYFPEHPYLLCVMTRGERFHDLESAVSDISRFVYGKIDEQF